MQKEQRSVIITHWWLLYWNHAENLEGLKADDETWEESFEAFIHGASRWHKDVLAGCQYYYKSKNDGLKNEINDERNVDIKTNDENEINNISKSEVDFINISVSVNLWN